MTTDILTRTVENQRREARTSLEQLRPWLGVGEYHAINECLSGEEWQFFAEKIGELLLLIETMPKTYETDGEGKQAMAYLHYFAGGEAHWYITEKDQCESQDQAFGFAELFKGEGELGYISIPEIIRAGGELDLYWEPKRLEEIDPEKETEES